MQNERKSFRDIYLAKRLKKNPRWYWISKTTECWLASVMAQPIRVASKSSGFHQPFLFVVGSGRSGNTLFRRLLMEKWSIYIPPETYVLPKIVDYRVRGRALSWSALVDLTVSAFEYHPEFETFEIQSLRAFALEARSYPPESQTLQDLLLGLYGYFSRHAGIGCDWLGDKTPLNTLNLGRIDRYAMPGAHYCYLLRDGVDVAVSYVDAGIYGSLEEAAERWVLSQRSWEEFRCRIPNDKRLEVRYEDLVSAPDSVIGGVVSKLRIPERESPIDLASALGDVGRREHHSNVMKKTSVSSVGKGRRALTTSERKRLRPILSGWLEHCGYAGI